MVGGKVMSFFPGQNLGWTETLKRWSGMIFRQKKQDVVVGLVERVSFVVVDVVFSSWWLSFNPF